MAEFGPCDLDIHKCTIEEREEYEPHIDRDCGFCRVDYKILAAEDEADVNSGTAATTMCLSPDRLPHCW